MRFIYKLACTAALSALLTAGCTNGLPVRPAVLLPGMSLFLLSSRNVLSADDVRSALKTRQEFFNVFVPTTFKGQAVEVAVEPSADTNSIIGVRHVRNGDWDQALKCFDAALKSEPNDHHSLFASGLCYEKLGDESVLQADFNRESVGFYRNVHFRKARGCYEQAVQHYKDASLNLVEQKSRYDASRIRAQSKLEALRLEP